MKRNFSSVTTNLDEVLIPGSLNILLIFLRKGLLPPSASSCFVVCSFLAASNPSLVLQIIRSFQMEETKLSQKVSSIKQVLRKEHRIVTPRHQRKFESPTDRSTDQQTDRKVNR